MKHEIYNLQILRGIAALLVVFEHLLPSAISKYIPPGQIGVSIFFFISGFIMVYSFKENESGLLFLKKRILRIYPTYLILSSLLILYFYSQSFSLTYLIHNLTLIPFLDWNSSTSETFNVHRSVANPVSWTLYYEMYFYFTFSIMKFLFREKKKVVLMTAGTMGIILAISSMFHKNNELGFYNHSLLNMISSLSITSFIAGMISATYITSINKKPGGRYYLIIIYASWFLIHIFERYRLIESEQVIDLLSSSIPSWILCILIIRAKKYEGIIFNYAHKIGTISYSLYLFHSNFYILKNKLQLSTQIGIIYFAITTLVSIYVSSLSFKYIESNKFFMVNKKS